MGGGKKTLKKSRKNRKKTAKKNDKMGRKTRKQTTGGFLGFFDEIEKVY